jgi:hypothetical protein
MAKTKRTKRPGRRQSRGGDDTVRHGESRTAVRSQTTTWMLRGLPVLIAIAGGVLYFALNSERAAAITVVAGTIGWLTLALSTLGSQVPPRDRLRGGAIDFGRRN